MRYVTNNQPRTASGEAIARLAMALTSGTTALLVTELNGVIRRVACPTPGDVERVAPDLSGVQIATLFSEADQPLLENVLSRASVSGNLTFANLPVHLAHELEDDLFLGLSNLARSTRSTSLLAWQLAVNPNVEPRTPTQHVSRLQHRLDTMEARLEAQRNTTRRARQALQTVAATKQSLAKALAASRDLRQQQAHSLKQTITDKDKLIERTRALHSAAVEAQRVAETARARLSFLADASWTFSETLDVDTTLQRIANMIVPDMAECCIIDLLEDDGDTLKPPYVVCTNPAIEERLVRETPRSMRESPSSDPLRRAILGGHADAAYVADNGAGSCGYLALAEAEGLSACLVAPLRSRDRTFGSLTIASSRPEHRYEAHDMRFIEDLALRAAQALDNSMLFQQVQEAATDRERYLSMASHELRSPLAVVSGFGSLLLRYVNSPHPDFEKMALVGREMLEGIERLDMLTNNLLTSASLEASTSNEQRRPVDLNDLLQHTLERINVSLSAEDGQRVHIESPHPVYGVWNADAIERAISNVLSNALKYSPADKPVTVTVECNGTEAALTVCDRGIGMSDAEMQDLFTPFARGQTARQTAHGTGLGLYITNQIIKQHGGRLDVQSEEGKGSAFTIHLPLGGDD